MGLLKEDISRIKEVMGLTFIIESIVGDRIECDECDHNWKIEDGGDDLYICHMCGNDNKPKSSDGEIDEQEDGGEPAPSGPSMTTWETGLTRGKANPIDGTSKWDSGINRGKGNPIW